jgi:hypothetical protein
MKLIKSTSQKIYIMMFALLFYAASLLAQIDARIGLGSLTMNISEINAPEGANTLIYPREYTVYGSMGSVYGGGFLIAARNFRTRFYFDEQALVWKSVSQDTIIPYFVCEATTNYYRDIVVSTVLTPGGFKRYWRYKAPLREIDGENFSDPTWEVYDIVGGEDMISDQMIEATINTASGISLTQRAYSFANPNFDDFVIVEYVFKNTGNIDGDDDIEYPDNQVQQCYLGLKFKPQPSGLTGRIIQGAGGWNAQVDDWIDYFTGDYGGEPIRVIYGWDGDAAAVYYPNDDEGDQLPASGILMSPQYPGMAILHVDRAVNDPLNDPDQPLMSYYSFGGAFSSNALSIGGGGVGVQTVYNILSTPGFFTSPIDWNTWNSNFTENWAVDNDPNREHYKTGTLGFGQYNFNAIGDSVSIVTCYTVGSMGWENCVSIGYDWKEGNISSTEKNIALRAGRDTLLTKISQIKKLFENGDGQFDLQKGANLIPSTPESPGLHIQSDVGRIVLMFTDVNVEKYRIYRRLKPEFFLEDPPSELLRDPYPMIAELNADELIKTTEGLYQWIDENVIPTGNYWYAVTAVNGMGVESSKFLTRTDPSQSDPWRGSASPYQDAAMSLDSVYAVPNPYHVKGDRLYSAVNFPQRTIRFVGLPAQCRIRIYTQNGDLVATVQHELSVPPSDSEDWRLITDTDQFVASGLYVYVIDSARDGQGKELGLSKVGKLVIIR